MSSELIGDRRLMGALAVITKGSSLHPDVFVHRDEPRIEVSSMLAKLAWWPILVEGALGFPGGGRADAETLYQALGREIKEELLFSKLVRLPQKKSAEVAQQVYPSVAAQLPRDQEENHLNQIAVTSVTLPYSEFSRNARSSLDQLVAEQVAQWISLEELYQISLQAQAQENTSHGYVFRPQVLTAAKIWYLTRFSGLKVAQVKDQIIAGNRQTIAFIAREAKRMNRSVVNGTLEKNGRLTEDMIVRDRHFILGIPRK